MSFSKGRAARRPSGTAHSYTRIERGDWSCSECRRRTYDADWVKVSSSTTGGTNGAGVNAEFPYKGGRSSGPRSRPRWSYATGP